LGLVSNSIAYIGQGIGSIFSVYLVYTKGIVKSMSFASLLSIPFILSLIFPTLAKDNPGSGSFFYSPAFIWIITILTTFVNGFGQGIAQPASGTFISDCATERSKGFFFAFFWAFYMGSQVVGSLISGVIFSSIPFYWYPIIMFLILTASTVFMFYLKMPIVAKTNNLRERTDSVIISALPRRQDMAGDSAPLIGDSDSDRMDALLANGGQDNAEKPLGIKEVANSMWNLFMKPRFQMLIPQCAWTGVSIAFFSGNLVEMMTKSMEEKGKTPDYALGQANFAMILFGVGEILGCFFIGWIVDKYGSYRATVVNCVIMAVMGLITLIYAIVYDFGVLAFFMCFLWGF
jgi:MFS family permease